MMKATHDVMYDEAVRIVTESRQAYDLLGTARLRVATNRAARMIERMNARASSPPARRRPREVIAQRHRRLTRRTEMEPRMNADEHGSR